MPDLAPSFDTSKFYLVDGATLNAITAELRALRPLMELTSETLEFFRGDKTTKIEVKAVAKGFTERSVQLCDENGATFTGTILIK